LQKQTPQDQTKPKHNLHQILYIIMCLLRPDDIINEATGLQLASDAKRDRDRYEAVRACVLMYLVSAYVCAQCCCVVAALAHNLNFECH
jgi:hypothetical protein